MSPPVVAATQQELFGVFSLAPALVLLLGLPLALLAGARMPGTIRRAREAARGRTLRSFLVGVFAALATLLLAAARDSSPIFGFPLMLALVASLALGFLGLVAEARDLGCVLRGRDPATPGPEGGATAVGWLVLAGVPLLFPAGPLVLLYLWLRAVGGAALAVAAPPREA